MNNGVQGIQGDTGNGIVSISKTGTSGLVDTYTITYTNGNTTTFTVSNGKGISSIVKTGSAGLVDTYRITYNDGTYFDYTVTNGQDGEVTEEELQDVYEQMSSELEDSTATGTSIDTSDSAYWKAKLQPKGNTSQNTYIGYNLFDANTVFASKIQAGTVSINNKGQVVLNGTFNSLNRGFSVTLPAGSYCGSEPTNKLHLFWKGSDSLFNTNRAVTYEEETTLTGYIYSGTYDNIVIEPMIYEAPYVANKTYEPYVGGKASPNPDYQQEIQVVKGSNNIVVSNSDNTQSQNYPITLPNGMELAKIPNTNYIDEIDIKNKKLIKRTQKIASYNGETITTDYISTTGGLDVGATVYYGISSVETTITDTTLINQLNDIYNKLKTYQGVSHITQTNADLPFVLTLDYKKSNLLRIKALENA